LGRVTSSSWRSANGGGGREGLLASRGVEDDVGEAVRVVDQEAFHEVGGPLHLTDHGQRGHQPEAADEERAFFAGQAVVGVVTEPGAVRRRDPAAGAATYDVVVRFLRDGGRAVLVLGLVIAGLTADRRTPD